MLIVVELERLLPGHPHFSMLLAKNNHFFLLIIDITPPPKIRKPYHILAYKFFSKKNTYKNSTHCCNVFQKK